MGQVLTEEYADLSRKTASLSPSSPREPLIESLREQLGKWKAMTMKDAPGFSSGIAAVDQLLPGGGLRHGMLVEWVGAEGELTEEQPSSKTGIKKKGFKGSRSIAPLRCSSAATLALLAARQACREGGLLVVIDRPRTFYPPAAATWGVDLGRLIIVRPQNARDELWAVVQALRSPVVAAVWASVDRLDSRAFRRLQLSAEAGRALGVLVRPPSARVQPTWAEVRLEVGPISMVRSPLHGNHRIHTTEQSRFIYVRVAHCHGGRAGSSTMLQIDDVARAVRQMSSTHVTHSLPMAAELADPASRPWPARA